MIDSFKMFSKTSNSGGVDNGVKLFGTIVEVIGLEVFGGASKVLVVSSLLTNVFSPRTLLCV